jgi:hypothetical protein
MLAEHDVALEKARAARASAYRNNEEKNGKENKGSSWSTGFSR